MKRILVIGCPGAGKSTFARNLRQITGLRLYYLDMIWHNPDKSNLSCEAFDEKIRDIVTGDSWIIDGNYSRTLELRLQRCDTVFLLDYPLDICLAGAESRIGTKREDLPWVEEEFDSEFRKWIEDFPDKKLPDIYRLLETYRDKADIHIFKNRAQADTYLDALRNA